MGIARGHGSGLVIVRVDVGVGNARRPGRKGTIVAASVASDSRLWTVKI